jgi:hypothetical protein
MHTLSPNFQEDMQFPKVIVVKPDSAKSDSRYARAGGVIAGEVEDAEGCTRLGHHLLELLLLVPEAVLLLALALVAGVVPVVVVVLIGGVELLPLGTVGDEVGP